MIHNRKYIPAFIWIAYLIWFYIHSAIINKAEIYIFPLILSYIAMSSVVFLVGSLILPKFYERKKFILLTFSLLLTWLLYASAAYLIEAKIESRYYGANYILTSYGDYLIGTISRMFLLIIFGMAYYFASYAGRKEADALKMENDFLKAQINPHFLINSINNLSGEIAKTNPAAAGHLDALGRMMIYSMMQTGPDGKVPLARELEHIDTKILFYNLRFPGTASIHFNHPEIPQHLRIPPMLLITLVENALKYGEFNKKDKPIDISAHLSDKSLLFTVSNWIRKGSPDLTFSVGLPNLKRRLEMFYKKNFHLETKQVNNTYFAELIIPL